MKNFTVFTRQILYFNNGPLIISGQNGSGKSSIAAAIAIALGVSESNLGFQKKYSDFIKKGSDSSTITLSLVDKTRPVIKCIISLETAHRPLRFLKINGRSEQLDENSLFNFLKSYKININSLSMFMSQERVSLFSSLKGNEMLKETLTLADNLLLQSLSYLHLLTKETESLKKPLSDVKREIEEKKTRFEDLSIRLQKMKNYQEDVKKLELLKARLLHLNKNELKQEIKEINRKLNEIDHFLNESVPIEMEMDQRKEILDNNIKKTYQTWIHSSAKLKEKNLMKLQIQEKIVQERMTEQKVKEEIESLKVQIELEKEKLAELEKTPMFDFDGVEIETDVFHQRKKIEEILLQIQQIQTKIKFEKEEKSDFEKTKKEIEDYPKQIEASLIKHFTFIPALQDFSQKLKDVYGPIAKYIFPKNEKFAAYLHKVIGVGFLSAFLTSSEESKNQLISLSEKKGFQNLRIIYFPASVSHASSRKFNADWIQMSLDESFLGDDYVKKFVVWKFHLNKIAVLNTRPNDLMTTALKNEGFLEFFYEKICYQIHLHRYLKSDTISASKVKQSFIYKSPHSKESFNLLISTIQSKGDKINNLEIELSQLQEEKSALETDLALNKSKLSAIKEQKLKQLHLEKSISEKRRQVSSMESRLDFLTKTSIVHGHIKKNIKKKIAIMKEMVSLLEEITNAQIDNDIFHLEMSELEEKYNPLKSKNTRARQQQLELQKRGQQLVEERNQIKVEFTKELNELSSNPETLKTQIADLSTKVNSIKYEEITDEMLSKLEADIKQLNEMNKSLEEEFETKSQKLADDGKKIRENISSFVVNVSQSFNALMQKSGRRGFVEFIPAEIGKTDDKIEISVAFKGSMASLSSNQHSGGEKSVAVFLYILSLQQSNLVPFRIVDEVNQGMDAINEEATFEQMADSVFSSETKGQFVLITPKPMRKRFYRPHITYLIIGCGPGNHCIDCPIRID